MQTFLPYSSFTQSAQVLDRQRLGKQRVEVLQILKSLSGQTNGWINHPAVKMWRGHEESLIEYGVVICQEWIARGYRDTCQMKISQFRGQFKSHQLPKWIGDKDFHLSHQSNLIRKLPSHYGKFFPDVPNNLEYVWPVKEDNYENFHS